MVDEQGSRAVPAARIEIRSGEVKNVVKSKEGMVNEPPTRVLGAPETFATTTVLSTRGRFSLEDESQLFPDMCQRLGRQCQDE